MINFVEGTIDIATLARHGRIGLALTLAELAPLHLCSIFSG